MMDDNDDSPYRGRSNPTVILSSTSKLEKSRMRYFHLSFPIKWEKMIFQRDGKWMAHCWLLSFMHVSITIPPFFHLMLENIGDGQIGVYLKSPREPYRMVVSQEGTQDREIEPYTFEGTRYAVTHIGELQTVRIEERPGEGLQDGS
jgi:hypothetical protein